MNTVARRRVRMIALAAALILQTMMAAPLFGASVSCDSCGHTQRRIKNWPICSPEQINALSFQAGGDLSRAVRMKAGAFTGLGFPPPGRARMELSGLVDAGGASCARHILAGADRDAKTKAGRDSRHVVLQIYTPNTEIQQSGILVDYPFAPYAHDGLGGWVPNGYANLVLELPHTRPEDLEAGKRYPAVAHYGTPTSGWLYRDWRGQYLPYYPKSGPNDDGITEALAGMLTQLHDQLSQGLAGHPGLSDGLNDDAASSGLLGEAPTAADVAREYAFQGTQRYAFARTLKGTVTIDRIRKGGRGAGFNGTGNRGVVAGHFKVRGAGKLRAESSVPVYDRKSGRLVDDRQVSQDDSKGTLKVSGHFVAPNFRPGVIIGRVGKTVVVDGHSGPANERKPLHIESHSPAIGEKNVDWEQPGICVTFDRPIALNSLDDDSFYLEYLDDNRRLQKVAVNYVRLDANTVRLLPRTELKDGVRYRVQIKAGTNGVRGRDDRPLDADYSWNFYTTVDLDDDEPMSELSELVDPHEGVEAHVFQVSRDAALVSGKPTMARVYTKWAERDDVASDWQVRKFAASVRIHGDRPDGPVIGQKENVVIQRPDEYSRDDERHAINTVNVYSLNIDAQPDTIFAEVRPKTECDTSQREFYSDGLALDYSPLQATLNVTYYFIPVGEWADGVPNADRALATNIVAGAARFTQQNMPVIGVNMMPGGDMPLSDEWKQDVQDAAHKYPKDIRNKLMRKLEDQMSTPDARRSDIIIGFMPYEMFPLGGHTYSDRWFDDDALGPSTFPIPAVAISVKPETARLASITHEFGHVFGLGHIPFVAKAAERLRICKTGSLSSIAGVGKVVPNVSIQGFRMAAGGRRGANKSVIEGNAQSTRGLVPLMFPCMGSKKAPFYITKPTMFISDRQYARLLTNMARYQTQGLFTQRGASVPLMLATNTLGGTAGRQPGQALAEVAAALRPPARGLLIAGHIGADGAAGMDWARRYSGHPRTPEDHGDWRLKALDAGGSAVAQQRFALQTDPNDDTVFRIALDDAQDAREIRLYRGDEQLAILARSAHAPQARITGVTQPEADRVRIAWTSQDADGDDLTHQLLYAPSPRGPWIALTGGDPRQSITVDRSLLAPGPQPTLKLIASDGFNETTTTRPVQATAGLRVLAHAPVDDSDAASVSADDGIFAIFNTDLAADAITQDTFKLEDPAGQRVPASVAYRSIDHTATLSPNETLVPGTPYSVTLAASIADGRGNSLNEPVPWQFTSPTPQRKNPPSHDEANATTDNDHSQGQGWLELDGTRQDFRIVKCGRTEANGMRVVRMRGKAATGLKVSAFVIDVPNTPLTHRLHVSSGKALFLQTRRKTDQGWETASGKPAGGPLIDIRDDRLTVDADLSRMGDRGGSKHVHLEAACPGLADK